MPWKRRWPIIASIVLGSLLAVDALVLAIEWPFTKSSLVKALREQVNGDVTIQGFEKTFFPKPGGIATGVVIHTSATADGPPLITVEKLTLRGAYSSLLVFSQHLDEVETSGMHIRVPADRGSAKITSSFGTAIGRFIAVGSVLEFASQKPDARPLIMQVHRTVLTPASAKAAMSFETSLAIPEPPGEVIAHGSIGPWQGFRTDVSGNYEFRHADLGEFQGMAGILNSTGKFAGAIEKIEVNGETDVPDFEITKTGHPIHLATQFQAYVEGRTGDVRLANVKSRFLRSEVDSEGSVASPEPGTAKNVSLRMSVNSGRIQDLLRLVSSGSPGLNGLVSLRYAMELPPGEGPLLERLKLTGVMGVAGARFTDPATQKGLEHISSNARPEVVDPADSVSNMSGRVSTSHGVATLSDIRFDVPGARAQLNGTYQLLVHRLDLRGSVQLDEKVSQTTTGVKSFLLKALDPIFSRKKHLSVVPVRISGVDGNITVGLN